MKSSFKLCLGVVALLFCTTQGQAQFFKKLAKKAEKAAERTVERRVETETSKKTDQALDSVLGDGSGNRKAPNVPQDQPNTSGSPSGNGNGQNSGSSGQTASTGPKTLQVYSKFDFVPGDKPIFFDDFTADFIGDFPAKWNTNGGGEVVTLDDSDYKWYAITGGSMTVPNLGQDLPEEYTIEFDLRYINLTNQTGSSGKYQFILSETSNLNNNADFALLDLNPCQFIAIGPEVFNYFQGDDDPIRNRIQRDLRKVYQDEVHVSIAVNKNRYRAWVNEIKIADLPQFITTPSKIRAFKIYMTGLNVERGERMLISNLKIAEGGVDLRRKLISEGKISTNGILFDSGSARLKPESMGIIRQIYQVLQQDKNIDLKIVGHTDSDGGEDANLSLSKSRADSVKKALVDIYGVSTNRLTTDGKGESEPVEENSSPEGKAKNRRVEFIKQ
ncbi:MAG: OmpA family protein [Bacteroidota bacterium]